MKKLLLKRTEDTGIHLFEARAANKKRASGAAAEGSFFISLRVLFHNFFAAFVI